MRTRLLQASIMKGDQSGRGSPLPQAPRRGLIEQAPIASLVKRVLAVTLGNWSTGEMPGQPQRQCAGSREGAPAHHRRGLPVSQPEEPAEQEAETMAEQVMRAPKGTHGDAASRKSSAIPLSGGGQPLDPGVRQFMEDRFEYDFSQVRSHTDSAAKQSASDLNARAYTVGRDIYFGHEQYRPHTDDGRRLLAHELTHVIQQSGDRQTPNAHARISPMIQRAVRFSSKTPLAIDHWTAGATSVAGDNSTVTTGDFEASAEVHVEADTAAELANWEVGFLQNDRITWERNYYTRTNADGRGKFLEKKLVVPNRPLRDHANGAIVWAAPGEFADVAVAAGGATAVDIKLTSTDNPSSPETIHGSGVTGDASDGGDNIFERRIGDNFISFISAHNSATDEWRHLELIYWSGQATADFAPQAGGGVSITKGERVLGQSRRFRWSRAADQPAIGETLSNDYVNGPGNFNITRVDGWT